MENKIKDLIEEGKKYNFSNNSYNSSVGVYSRASVEMQAWIAECEDIILSKYGKNSSPWKLYEQFDRRELDGYEQDDFDKQKNIILSALTACLRLSPISQTVTTKNEPDFDTTKVFIVHGHDEEAKSKTARFIEKLGFEAIILHEQASSSKTIIEKIEEYSNVGFGIVLYTPCDIGAKKTDNPGLKARARQNVVFEHGFLIGKIGRSKVCALVKGDIETPNDISGVVYVHMDSSDAWCYTVAKEMKKIGYDVDMNKI